MSAKSRSEINDQIAQAIANDPALRERLLSDPRAVLAEIAGIDIPDFVNVTVHEETLTDIHLVIGASMQEISEEDLELVSGGWNPTGKSSKCGGSCGP